MDMRNNERLPQGRQRFGITAAPSIPMPGVKVEPKPQRLGKRARMALAGLAVLGAVETTGAVITEQTNNQPLSTNTIPADLAWPWNLGRSAAEDIQGFFNKEAPVSSTFDNNADRQVIKAGVNTVAVSETELKKAYEEQSAQNTDGPTVIFPVKFTAEGQEVNYAFEPPLTGIIDGQTGKPKIIESPGAIKLDFRKNLEIVVPAENAEIFQFPPRVVNGQRYFQGVFIKWQQGKELFSLAVSSQDIRTFIPLGETANAPLIPSNEGGNWRSKAQNGLQLPLAKSIMKVDFETNLGSFITFDKYNPKTGRWESTRANFVTDNSTGQTKLMLPQ